MKLGITTLAIATAGVLAAQEAPVVREGAYWVGSISDSFTIGPQSSLQVNTRGTVVVKRGSGDQVTYRVPSRQIADDRVRPNTMLLFES